LPVEVHTKFIEENKALIQSLLNNLIGDFIQDKEEKIFEKRFGLKSKPLQIRIRILDKEISDLYFSGSTDLTLIADELIRIELPCSKVYITENEMNFLTLPAIKNASAIFGKGFAIIRSYFPMAKSMMMDMQTFNTFKEMSVENDIRNPPKLNNLDESESFLYNFLKEHKRRLEQEKITYQYSLKYLVNDC
jgi:hypothetical protein